MVLAEGEYRDRLHDRVAMAVLAYLEDKPKLDATAVEDVLDFECPVETRKSVLLSLQKQGMIALVGTRRTAFYKRVFRRKCSIQVNNKTLELLIRIYGYKKTREVLHAIDPAVFPKFGEFDQEELPFD